MSSSSGSTQFPAGPKAPGQPNSGQPPSGDPAREPNAKVSLLSVELKNLANKQRLVGEILSVSRDQTVRIRTPHGEIEIQSQAPEVRALQKGDRVEVDLGPGRPPQTARITRIPDNAAPPRDTSSPSTPPDARPSETPVDIRLTPPDRASQTQPVPTPTPPPARPEALPGQSVRTERVTPERVLEYLARPPEQIIDVEIPETFWRVTGMAETISVETANFIAGEILNLSAPIAQDVLPPQPQTPAAPMPILETLAQTPLPSLHMQNALISAPVTSPAQSPQILLQSLITSPAEMPQIPPVLTLNPPVAGITESFPIPPGSDVIQGLKIPVPDAITVPSDVNAIFNAPIVKTSKNVVHAPLQIQTISLAPVTAFHIPLPGKNLLEQTLPLVPGQPKIQNLQPAIPSQTPLILGNQKAVETAAQVIAQTPQKLPIAAFFSPALQDFQFMILHLPAEMIPTGANLSLMPQTPGQTTTQPLQNYHMSALPIPAPLYFLSPEPWPMMQEIANLLAAAAPRAAHAMAGMTPSPSNPAQLGPAALFFIAAIRGGDLTQWLGDKALDAIRKAGRNTLMTRMGQESTNLSRLAGEPVSQDWRGLSLPLQYNSEYHKIALYYKHDDSNSENDQKGGRQTRFIFDLSLDRMGPVQLDGLFRGSRLDLIVRTQTHFSQAMQMEMRKLYTGALAETNITGELSFQNQLEQWVKINPTNNKLAVAI